MKEILIQINNVDGDPIELFFTQKPRIIAEPDLLLDWFRRYDDSDMYNEYGIDGFEHYILSTGNFKIKRMLVKELNL